MTPDPRAGADAGGPLPELPFDGERFVAADKPPGWLSVPSRWGAADERPCLGRILEAHLGVRLWPLHRLDEEVTGLVLFARDASAHAEASRWFEHGLVDKHYEAFTELAGAAPPPFEDTWRSRLLRGKKRAYESPHGKPCETRARLVGEEEVAGSRVLSWELQPLTGRPHQLRVELARHGHPILGDVLYGAHRSLPGGSIALRCVRLGFRAPSATGLGLPEALGVRGLGDWLTAVTSSREVT